MGEGFIVTAEEAKELGLGKIKGLEKHIKQYRNGRDLTESLRGVLVIDLFGLNVDEVRLRFPAVYQRILTRVKPERETNNRASYREKWWIFGEPVKTSREALAGLSRFISTVKTSKHRTFQFLDASILPDSKLISFASEDAFTLGVLSSKIHSVWTQATQALLEDRPTYVKSASFEKFPFPLCGEKEKARIRELAEALDAHRKQVQARHGVTLTGLYNVLEKLRAVERGVHGAEASAGSKRIETSDDSSLVTLKRPEGRAPAETLTEKEKSVHDRGLVSTLKSLHDDLDAAVSAAYGWPSGLTDAEILERLVALNAERAAEEARGVIHWLRPEYQSRNQKSEVRSQKEMDLPERKTKPKARKSKIVNRKLAWPKTLPERMHAVETALHAAAAPIAPADLAKQFARAKPADVTEILNTLETFGRARKAGAGKFKA